MRIWSKWRICLAAATALIAPWIIVLTLQKPADRFDWSCRASYEINTISSDAGAARAIGVMVSDYHADGSGVARYSGTLTRETTPPRRTVVHRATEFGYGALGSFLRISTHKATSLMDDNTSDALAISYVSAGFKPGHTEYFQIRNVGEDAVVAGFRDMPRIYCATSPDRAMPPFEEKPMRQ